MGKVTRLNEKSNISKTISVGGQTFSLKRTVDNPRIFSLEYLTSGGILLEIVYLKDSKVISLSVKNTDKRTLAFKDFTVSVKTRMDDDNYANDIQRCLEEAIRKMMNIALHDTSKLGILDIAAAGNRIFDDLINRLAFSFEYELGTYFQV